MTGDPQGRGVNRGADSRASSRLARADGVANGHGREDRATRRVFSGVEAEYSDEPLRKTVTKASPKAFDLLGAQLESAQRPPRQPP